MGNRLPTVRGKVKVEKAGPWTPDDQAATLPENVGIWLATDQSLRKTPHSQADLKLFEFIAV